MALEQRIAPAPTLRGRDAELTILGQHLDQLLSGAGTVVVVEGGAGIGKSRLLGEVTAMADRLSIRVGSGVADPADAVVPLSVLMAALFEGPAPILERSALGDAHASPEQRYWLLQDLETLLEGAALKGPLLVCLDDVQWADTGTAAALRALPSRLATVPIGWVVALRPGQGSPRVRDSANFLEDRGASRIVLGPLDQSAVAQMAADVLGAEPDSDLLEMAERSAGTPFLLVELLSGLREEGLVRVDSGRAEISRVAVATSRESEHAVAAGANVRLCSSSSYGRFRSWTQVFRRRRRCNAQPFTVGAAQADGRVGSRRPASRDVTVGWDSVTTSPSKRYVRVCRYRSYARSIDRRRQCSLPGVPFQLRWRHNWQTVRNRVMRWRSPLC